MIRALRVLPERSDAKIVIDSAWQSSSICAGGRFWRRWWIMVKVRPQDEHLEQPFHLLLPEDERGGKPQALN
jgi:hypothetical protein